MAEHIREQAEDKLNLYRGLFVGATTRFADYFNELSEEVWEQFKAPEFDEFDLAIKFARSIKISDFTRLPRDYEPGVVVSTVLGEEVTLDEKISHTLTNPIRLEEGAFLLPLIGVDIIKWSAVNTRPKIVLA